MGTLHSRWLRSWLGRGTPQHPPVGTAIPRTLRKIEDTTAQGATTPPQASPHVHKIFFEGIYCEMSVLPWLWLYEELVHKEQHIRAPWKTDAVRQIYWDTLSTRMLCL